MFTSIHSGREILALAGDMHASCEGHVTKGPGGAHLLTQVITSPIANRPPKGFKVLNIFGRFIDH